MANDLYRPSVLARELKEETARPVEIVHPVAQDLLLAHHFARLFACLTAARSERLARDERLLLPLIRIVRRHGMVRPPAVGPSSKAIPAPGLCSPDSAASSARDTGVSGQPLPAASRLRPRSGNHTACLPRATARAPGATASGQGSDTRPSSNAGRLRRPEPYDPRPRPPNRRNAEPLSSCHSVIGASHAQFRSRHGRPIVRCLASGGRDPRTLRVNKAGLLATPLLGAKRLNKRRQP